MYVHQLSRIPLIIPLVTRKPFPHLNNISEDIFSRHPLTLSPTEPLNVPWFWHFIDFLFTYLLSMSFTLRWDKSVVVVNVRVIDGAVIVRAAATATEDTARWPVSVSESAAAIRGQTSDHVQWCQSLHSSFCLLCSLLSNPSLKSQLLDLKKTMMFCAWYSVVGVDALSSFNF